jgi:CheY-like chemotaxis protein
MGTASDARAVMLVEDDDGIRDILRELLEEAGYRVFWAANGLEALAQLRLGRVPRVILLDLMMPLMDGVQFRAAQRRDPALAPIPVVVISADERMVPKINDMHVDGYLPKPFELRKLLETVNRYCGTSTRGRRLMVPATVEAGGFDG